MFSNRRWLVLVIACGLPLGTLAAGGKAFRVCADPKNLPFSAESQDGLENKIAELWAEKLDVPLEYTWFPQRRGFIRNTLKAPKEGGDGFKCDVVMGVAAEFDQVLTTEPYYRSTYALVYAKGRKLGDIKSSRDLVELDPGIRDRLKIGAFTPTPGIKWLARYGMTEQLVAFPAMSGDPAAYPGQIIETELVDGRLDAAIVWGPIAGYFAKQAKSAELVVIPLESEPGIQFDFAISVGVRYGDSERKQQLDELIRETSSELRGILEAYHVPVLNIVPDTNP